MEFVGLRVCGVPALVGAVVKQVFCWYPLGRAENPVAWMKKMAVQAAVTAVRGSSAFRSSRATVAAADMMRGAGVRRSGGYVEDLHVAGFRLLDEFWVRGGCGDRWGDGFAGGLVEYIGAAVGAVYMFLVGAQGDFHDQVPAVHAADYQVGFGEVAVFVLGDESRPDGCVHCVVKFCRACPVFEKAIRAVSTSRREARARMRLTARSSYWFPSMLLRRPSTRSIWTSRLLTWSMTSDMSVRTRRNCAGSCMSSWVRMWVLIWFLRAGFCSMASRMSWKLLMGGVVMRDCLLDGLWGLGLLSVERRLVCSGVPQFQDSWMVMRPRCKECTGKGCSLSGF